MNDPMIQEMEAAYATTPQRSDTRAHEARVEAKKRERTASGAPLISGIDYAAIARTEAEKEERGEAVSRAVQKYFRPGMKAEGAFKLLRQMKDDGFEITEYRYEGARVWPDGELKPFLGEVGKLTYQRRHPKGTSDFIAQKQYGRRLLIVTKHVVVSFRVDDSSGVITQVEGDIWANGI